MATRPFFESNSYAEILEIIDSKGYVGTLQVFTESGTYNKPAGLKSARIVAIGGGGGGGTGRNNPANPKSGGSGGGGGGWSMAEIPAHLIGETELVTVGAGGTGTQGNVQHGTDGGASSFGSFVLAGGGGGGSGVANVPVGAGSAGVGGVTGGAGQRGTTDGTASATIRPLGLAPGGGGGGSGNGSDGVTLGVPAAGSPAGTGCPGLSFGSAGPDQHGGTPPSRVLGDIRGGAGGGGGAGNPGGQGYDGGDGAFPGGGGGGSGAGTASGKPGNGGAGVVIIFEEY